MSSSKPDSAADGGQRTVAEQIRYASSDSTRAERLAVPANDAIFQSYNSDRAKLERENEWANASQWRCMPRLQDFAAAMLDWYSPAEKWKRTSLLIQCARTAPGHEPLVPYLTDPRQARVYSYDPDER